MRWKKIIRITALVVFGPAAVLFAAAYAIVHTEAFNRFVLAKVIQEAQNSTGARIEIKSIAIHWNKLGVDFYDLAAYGSGASAQTPFFRGDHLSLGLKIVSLLSRKIDLEDIVFDRPVLDLRVTSSGETNFPKSPSIGDSSSSADQLLDMAIRHVAINSGQISYNDGQIPVSAEIDGFRANVDYGIFSGVYKGRLGYDRGRIIARDFNPFEHSAQLQFVASRKTLKIDSLIVAAGHSRVTAHATLTDYANPEIEGNYDAVLFTPEIARFFKTSELPAGQVTFAGTMRYQNVVNRPFLEDLFAVGHLSSSQLDLRADQVSARAKSVRGEFLLDKGNLLVRNVEADLLRGHLIANAEVMDVGGRPSTHVVANLKNVSLEAVSDALPAGRYDRLHFLGRANASINASWSATIQNILLRSRVTIFAPSKTKAAQPGIPVNGIVDVTYDAARDTASFGQSRLQTGKTQISLTGTVSKSSNLSVQANTEDLHELSALVSEIEAAVAASPPTATDSTPFDIHGAAHFSGQVSGSVKNPSLHGQIFASDVQAEGSAWQSLRTRVDLSPSSITFQDGELLSSQRGHVAFAVRAGLDRWSLKPSSPISIQTTAANISLADLERLGKLHYPISGVLSGNVSLQGSEESPTGHGSVQIAKASAWGETINNLAVNFQGTGTSLQSTARLQVPAGIIAVNLTYSPKSEQYEANVNASGLKLDQIHAVQARDLGITGSLALSASGQGTLKDPQLSANVKIAQFKVRDQSLSDAEAQVNVARQRANIALKSTIAQGDVEAKGEVELTGEYNTTASLDVRALPLGPLLATYMLGDLPNLQGQTEIHATLHGPLKDPARLQAQMEIPTLNLAYRSLKVALVQPLRLDYRDGRATLQETEFKGSGTDLTLQGVIPIKNATAFHIGAKGTMDLSLLQALTKGVKSSGRVELNLSSFGDLSHPTMQGQVRIENAYLATESLPVGIEGVDGQINIAGNRIEIAELKGVAGGGTMSVQGGMVYGQQMSFNLGLNANSVRVRYPEGLRSILNCNLQLNGSSADSTLSGRVLIDRLSFTQQFDLANFVTQFNAPTAPSPSVLQQNMKLNVAVQSAQDINLSSSQLSMRGASDVNLTGTMANPVLLGRVNLTGGEIFFLGKRYEVQNGTIEFSNPGRTEPLVNLSVATTVQQYDITLNFTGPVDRLRTNYTSNPSLPPADIINLLALGKTAEESATSDTSASVGAESVVAQGVASQFSGKIQKLAGISQLTIDPMAGNNQTNPGSQVAIQQRVTGNILLTFGTDVTSTQATTIQLQYRTSPQTTVSVLRDQNGGYAIDVRLHKTF